MKLRKEFVQGVEALILAMLCHWTNADGAAVVLFVVCIGLLFGKSRRRRNYAIQSREEKIAA